LSRNISRGLLPTATGLSLLAGLTLSLSLLSLSAPTLRNGLTGGHCHGPDACRHDKYCRRRRRTRSVNQSHCFESLGRFQLNACRDRPS
jgi:hypothetical protein